MVLLYTAPLANFATGSPDPVCGPDIEETVLWAGRGRDQRRGREHRRSERALGDRQRGDSSGAPGGHSA